MAISTNPKSTIYRNLIVREYGPAWAVETNKVGEWPSPPQDVPIGLERVHSPLCEVAVTPFQFDSQPFTKHDYTHSRYNDTHCNCDNIQCNPSDSEVILVIAIITFSYSEKR